jgi:hypothetical protein
MIICSQHLSIWTSFSAFKNFYCLTQHAVSCTPGWTLLIISIPHLHPLYNKAKHGAGNALQYHYMSYGVLTRLAIGVRGGVWGVLRASQTSVCYYNLILVCQADRHQHEQKTLTVALTDRACANWTRKIDDHFLISAVSFPICDSLHSYSRSLMPIPWIIYGPGPRLKLHYSVASQTFTVFIAF